MVGGIIGNKTLIKYLVENGAEVSLTDILGRNALQIVLAQAYCNKKYANTKLSSIYGLLAPSSINIKAEGKLIKIDNHLMEFFMFNVMRSILPEKCSEECSEDCFSPGFSAADFVEGLKYFPNNVLLERRKKRNYISGILSKNEVSSNNPYNRKIFKRTIRGYYILNPDLEIKGNNNNKWVKV